VQVRRPTQHALAHDLTTFKDASQKTIAKIIPRQRTVFVGVRGTTLPPQWAPAGKPEPVSVQGLTAGGGAALSSHQRDSNPCSQSATRFLRQDAPLYAVESTSETPGLKFTGVSNPGDLNDLQPFQMGARTPMLGSPGRCEPSLDPTRVLTPTGLAHFTPLPEQLGTTVFEGVVWPKAA